MLARLQAQCGGQMSNSRPSAALSGVATGGRCPDADAASASSAPAALERQHAAAENGAPARIEALPASVALKVRGGLLAPNMGSHMLQLMYNALDAKASSISVKICLRTFTLSVRDDGDGMTFEDLRNCAERSFTSRLRHHTQMRDATFPSYGYRGESLAAISEFCNLEILSRSRARPAETCRKVIANDGTAILARVLDSTGVGTTVTCRDLFYNRPVARKMMMPSSNGRGASDETGASRLQTLLMLVRALAAIHPDVSFSVYEGARIQPVLSLAKCVGQRQAFARISKSVAPHHLFHVGLSCGGYLIKALLCPPSLTTLPRAKDEQFVYVNGRLCARCLVHKRMNRAYKDLWERSSCAPEPCAGGSGGAHVIGGGSAVGSAGRAFGDLQQVHFPQRKRRRVQDGPSILAPAKRCPVFLVRISCAPGDCSFAETSGHGDGAAVEFGCWDEVLGAIDSLCAEFFRSVEAPPEDALAAPQCHDSGAVAHRGSSGETGVRDAMPRGHMSVGGWEGGQEGAESGRACSSGVLAGDGGGTGGGGGEGGMPAKRWAPWGAKDTSGSGGAQCLELGYRRGNGAADASGGLEGLGGMGVMDSGAEIEEEAVDEEELKVLEWAMKSAESACRLAKSQGELNPTITNAVSDASLRGPRIALPSLPLQRQARQQEPLQRWFNKGLQQWQLVPASALVPRNRQGRPGGSGGGGLRRTSTIFAEVAARKRQTERENVAKAESTRSHTLQDGEWDGGGASSRDTAPESAPRGERLGAGHGLQETGGLARTRANSASARIGQSAAMHTGPRLFGDSSSCTRQQQRGPLPPPPTSCLADTAASADSPAAAVDAVATPPTAHMNQNMADTAQALTPRPTLESHHAAEDINQQESPGESGERGRKNPAGNGGAGEGSDAQVEMECEEEGATGDEAGGGRGRGAMRGLMDLEAMLESWDNPVIGAYGSASTHRILRIEKVEGQYRSQLKIDRAMLQQARVIGQAFNKWIVVQAGADVVLVDQHAADERVRLEAMERLLLHRDPESHTSNDAQECQEMLAGEGGGRNGATQLWGGGETAREQSSEGALGGMAAAANRQGRSGTEVWSISSAMLDSAVVLTDLSPAQNHTIARFHDTLSTWGFLLHPLSVRPTNSTGASLSSSFFAEGGADGGGVSMRGAGGWKLVAVPVVMGTPLGVAEFVDSLQELVSYAGARPPPPQAIRRVLVSKACRGAIMFGDKLAPRQCDQVVSSLRACALPFQCAHGRPTLVPLLRLAASQAPPQPPAAAHTGTTHAAGAGAASSRPVVANGYINVPRAQLPKPEWARWRSVRRNGYK